MLQRSSHKTTLTSPAQSSPSTLSTIYANALATPQPQVWRDLLSDPSLYPLMLLLGCTLSGCVGFGLHTLLHEVDVRVDPKKRNRLLRDWSKEGWPPQE